MCPVDLFDIHGLQIYKGNFKCLLTMVLENYLFTPRGNPQPQSGYLKVLLLILHLALKCFSLL